MTDKLIQELEKFEQTPEGWALDLRLSFADIIIKHMRRLGWDIHMVAHKVPMDKHAIEDMVHGDFNSKLSDIARVLHALGVKADIVEPDRIVGDFTFDEKDPP